MLRPRGVSVMKSVLKSLRDLVRDQGLMPPGPWVSVPTELCLGFWTVAGGMAPHQEQLPPLAGPGTAVSHCPARAEHSCPGLGVDSLGPRLDSCCHCSLTLGPSGCGKPHVGMSRSFRTNKTFH